jgi:integrase
MKAKRVKQWPRIYTQPNRNGQPTYYVDLRSVGAGRPGYATLAEARTRAEQARIGRANDGNAAFTLSQHIRLDAFKASEILAPHDVTILEAAKYYQKHVLAYKSAPTVKEIVEKYVTDARQRNLRPRTIGDLCSKLNTFAADFGERRLSDIALDELREWVADDEWEPLTRINYLTKLSQLYLWAMRKRWADSNLTEHIDRPKADDTTPEIFSVEQAETLLNHAADFELLPYVAIGFFAGVRTAELGRLNGKDINFETKAIRIGADVAKKRSQRIVDMQPALRAWLEPYRDALQAGANIIGTNFQRDRNRLVEAARLDEWKANGLRHSFGSYHFAMFRNDGETAHQMGNSVVMVHKHYKALVTREAAEKYWALRPTAAQPKTNPQTPAVPVQAAS